MKELFVLFCIAIAGCDAQTTASPCKPSPPQNLQVNGTTYHSIVIAFDEPNDVDSCPIMAYLTDREAVESLSSSKVNEPTPVQVYNGTHHVVLDGLSPATTYNITVISLSTEVVQSDPAFVLGTTDTAQ